MYYPLYMFLHATAPSIHAHAHARRPKFREKILHKNLIGPDKLRCTVKVFHQPYDGILPPARRRFLCFNLLVIDLISAYFKSHIRGVWS